MARLRLSRLPECRLADPAQDLRGLELTGPDGKPAGKIVELIVNTLTDRADGVVLDNGLQFRLRDLSRNGSAVHLVPRGH
jgi:hypothetical protein